MAASEISIIDLIRKYIDRLKENNIPVEKVLLFGSYIKGTSREDSDIDIAVISSAFKGNRYLDRRLEAIMPIMSTYEKGKLYQIPITDLAPDPDQPRKVIDPEALAELVTSIEKFGIIQPLLFRDAGETGPLPARPSSTSPVKSRNAG